MSLLQIEKLLYIFFTVLGAKSNLKGKSLK